MYKYKTIQNRWQMDFFLLNTPLTLPGRFILQILIEQHCITSTNNRSTGIGKNQTDL